MEAVPCNNCGSAEATVLRRFKLQLENEEAKLIRCSDCALAYLSPRPERERIGAYYPESYQGSISRVLAKGKTSRIFRMGVNMVVTRRTPKGQAPGRLLDVGCSNGAYLAALRDRGWDVEGIEFDGAAAEYARNERGLTIRTGNAETILGEVPSGSFDVVTMWHVLEHLYDPAAALANIRRVLRPGGILMLEVPLFDSPFSRLFGERWFPLDVPRHLYHFTAQTLTNMLRRSGFLPGEIKGVPSPEAIVWSFNAVRQGTRIEFQKAEDLSVSPAAMALAFPVSWAMAMFRASDTMSAVAYAAAAPERSVVQVPVNSSSSALQHEVSGPGTRRDHLAEMNTQYRTQPFPIASLELVRIPSHIPGAPKRGTDS